METGGASCCTGRADMTYCGGPAGPTAVSVEASINDDPSADTRYYVVVNREGSGKESQSWNQDDLQVYFK